MAIPCIAVEAGISIPAHACLYVQPHMLDTAVAFFTQMLGGWSEITERRINSDWGKVRFVKSNFTVGQFCLQLTEPAKDMPIYPDEVHHIALQIGDPIVAAVLIKKYFDDALSEFTPKVEFEKLQGGKIWLTIAGVFATPIELVPQSC